jgi:hypothetical protein
LPDCALAVGVRNLYDLRLAAFRGLADGDSRQHAKGEPHAPREIAVESSRALLGVSQWRESAPPACALVRTLEHSAAKTTPKVIRLTAGSIPERPIDHEIGDEREDYCGPQDSSEHP